MMDDKVIPAHAAESLASIRRREAARCKAMPKIRLKKKERQHLKLRKDKPTKPVAKPTKPARWKPGTTAEDVRWNKFHRDVWTSPAFTSLSVYARLLLLCIFSQWNGHNNGKLHANISWLREECGWGNSPRTLADAIRELVNAGFIRYTREHTRSRCAWFELTWITEEAE